MEYDPAILEVVAQEFRSDMWRSVVPEAVTESGVEVRRFGPVQATVFADLPETALLNQVLGAAEPGATEEGHLAEAVEWMRAREVDYRVPVAQIRPGATDAEIWLSDRGYEHGGGTLKYVRDTSPLELPVSSEIVIYELGDEEADGEGLSMIAAEALGLPTTAGTLFFSLPQVGRWRCYTAALRPGEAAVATGAMLIRDGVAQLGPGTTLPHARGRGCNTALLRRRIRDAAAAGCHTVFVELLDVDSETLSQPQRILYRAGFEFGYESRIWQRPALHPAGVH